MTGKQILINRGTESGFEKGDLVTIYTPQNVKDDESGEIFISEIPIGQAIITRLDKLQSFADITTWAVAGLGVWLSFQIAGLFDWSFGDAEVAYQFFFWMGLGLADNPRTGPLPR